MRSVQEVTKISKVPNTVSGMFHGMCVRGLRSFTLSSAKPECNLSLETFLTPVQPAYQNFSAEVIPHCKLLQVLDHFDCSNSMLFIMQE